MADCFLGEIRMFAGSRAPANWVFCEGQSLPINDYQALFALIGTTYGGDGVTTFLLPNLSGRVPVHQGTGGGLTPRILGQTGGHSTVTLTTEQLPPHSHILVAATAEATLSTPNNSILAAVPGAHTFYAKPTVPPPTDQVLAPESLQTVGSSQAHENRMPVIGMNFIIALQGAFPDLS